MLPWTGDIFKTRGILFALINLFLYNIQSSRCKDNRLIIYLSIYSKKQIYCSLVD